MSPNDLQSDGDKNCETCKKKYFDNCNDFIKECMGLQQKSKMGNLKLTKDQIKGLLGILTKSDFIETAVNAKSGYGHLATWIKNLV
jgi:hypothetical protein